MKINNYNIRRKGLEPLIATILLIVVSVILVTIVLTWGKEFSTSSLNKTNNFGELKASDATHFIYPKSAVDGVVQFTYSPPAQISNDINITHYRVVNIPEMTEPIALSEPKILSPSLNILELPCLYEYSTTTPDLYIQLITADNTYIDIKTRDAGMVCSSGGDGTEENPKIICTAEDLNAVRENLDWNYALGKDIDLQCFSRLDENGWEPIGNCTNCAGFPITGDRFIGTLNGRNKIIKNLYINNPDLETGAGLFGSTNNCTIQNINLIDINVVAKDNVGGIVGLISNSNVTNILVTGEVSGEYAVGGFAGYLEDSNLSYSSFTGAVSGIIQSIGGFTGEMIGSNILNSYTISDVTDYGESWAAGGFAGDVWGGPNTISNCYSKGTINGSLSVGGFLGYSQGAIITNSYSTNVVTGESDVGGFVGEQWGSNTIINSYWDMNSSTQETSVLGSGKTTSEMKTQSTFTDWDFSTVWAIDSTKNDGYPYLRNNPPR